MIRIAAAVVIDAEGRWLLVRKRGTSVFMQPGGKLEPGDDADQLEHIGRFHAPAANEVGFTVDADVFIAPLSGPVAPLAEIEEVRWIEPTRPGDLKLAPLLRDHLLPRAAADTDGCPVGS
jgi:8-oxo-dGTP diphosphatase